MSRIYEALKRAENPVVKKIEGDRNGQAPQDLKPQVRDGKRETQPIPNEERSFRAMKAQIPPGLPVLPFDGKDRRTAERYRILRTNILHHSARPKLIAVTSAGPGDGKTTSAINIAGALSLKMDSRVLLVDGDLRRSSIAQMLGIEESPGLVEVLSGERRLDEAIEQLTDFPNLHVLPAGRTAANPAELLDSPAWRALAAELRERFDFVIIDTTPLGVVADYDLIQAVSDGVILVARPDHTDRQAFEKALKQIPKGKLLGTLLNCVEDWVLWQTRDYAYYEQGQRQS